ncbi:Golgi phosphoprotein 3 (GPP34) [Sporobacter termitidis DSM 10068]|uniref:Golgi phosphoprotein 3 (GPP34) n=1 Tax=Sporobacter termitidis DSM 10068 TaxID=1123282 RepID=A0A1M5Z091_9FIRM|nr:GPP34 family phosphoprotein [Sporobacter termitidis]SHI17676.1 Golgi phosphoprotein 3 (GPP34) [Sporobacter termitidis DSM 10068]
MKDLSFTQEYLLCALSPKGAVPAFKSTEVNACLVAGGLLELLYLRVIAIDEKKKITVEKDLGQDGLHLEPLYRTIKTGKVMSVTDVASKYIFGSGKLLGEFVQALARPLTEGGYVSVEAGGLFHNKTLYVPKNDEVLKIIEKVRAELLESGAINDETVVLGAMLQKTGLIMNYFSKYEADRLKARLKEIEKSEAGAFVKSIVDYIDTLIAVLVAVGGSAGA